MARRAQPLTLAGIGAAGLVGALILGTAVAVLAEAGRGRLGPADWAALRFTVVQAGLSAALSVGLAIPVARALARRRFAGRGLLITLLGAPFILPVIVAVLGLLAVFGRSGWVSAGLQAVGLPPLSIYGLHGVVLAHVFFNLPLAVRLILHGWQAIPAERFRLAASLGFGPGDVARVLERPMLRSVVPGALLVVFLICTTSFAVALTLGGGPRATTVELAIYQAVRFEFDLGRAALLALVQIALTGAVALAALGAAVPDGMGAGLGRVVARWDADAPMARRVDAVWIGLGALFLLAPLLSVVLRGAPGLLDLPGAVWAAAGRSAVVALVSAALAVTMAFAVAVAVARLGRRSGRAVEATAMLGIAASPLVIGTGLFLLTFPAVDPVTLALPVTASVNAVMSLPFALRALIPAVAAAERNHGRLADSLGLVGWRRHWRATLPAIRRPLGFAAGLAAALSMGDLGVVALFADASSGTLPLALYRLMAAYRMDDAAAAALLLLAASLALFWVFDRGGRGHVEA
ncbi:thiamine/thiamine pyrophosphate ABC transporter permease ThiP [Rhodobacteraceae bacterium CCMM004]|nr:thiamine/thiamine pyrophosphate ABC transporter permease ThiP [Rhodobacteraceae bacterium CCMM004]